MAENGFFRTTLRGFHKTDVLNYIDSLHTAHCEELATLEMQGAELREQNEALRARLSESEAAHAELCDVRKKLEETQKSLEYASRRLTVAEEENRQLKAKLETVQATAERNGRLQTEVAIQKQQLDAQQEQLTVYEKLFGESKDAATYVQRTVSTKLQTVRDRTEESLGTVERMAAQLEADLRQMREKTAAIREEILASARADEQELSDWLCKFEQQAPTGTDSHFFRCAAGDG